MKNLFKLKKHVFFTVLMLLVGPALGFTNSTVLIAEGRPAFQNVPEKVQKEWKYTRTVRDFVKLPNRPVSSKKRWAVIRISPERVQPDKFEIGKGWKASGKWKILASNGMQGKGDGSYERWVTNGKQLPDVVNFSPLPKYDPFEFGGLVFCSIEERRAEVNFNQVCLIDEVDIQGLSVHYNLKLQEDGAASTNSTISALKLLQHNRWKKIKDFEEVIQTLKGLSPTDAKRCALALISGHNSAEFRLALIQQSIDRDLAVQISTGSLLRYGSSTHESSKSTQQKLLQSVFESEGISPEQKIAIEKAGLKVFLSDISLHE